MKAGRIGSPLSAGRESGQAAEDVLEVVGAGVDAAERDVGDAAVGCGQAP